MVPPHPAHWLGQWLRPGATSRLEALVEHLYQMQLRLLDFGAQRLPPPHNLEGYPLHVSAKGHLHRGRGPGRVPQHGSRGPGLRATEALLWRGHSGKTR
jgi:hypothetical protein